MANYKRHFKQNNQNNNNNNNSGNKINNNNRFKGSKFWCDDKGNHVDCCFNHIIGLPLKGKEPKPIFDYEMQIYDALQERKVVWIKKATGLGITEFMLRYLAWLCVVGSARTGFGPAWKAVIVTGPNINLAVTLIKRFKELFRDFFTFEDKETVAQINGVTIEAYPSHHLDAFRGLTNVKFIFLDEADFFPKGQQRDARDVSERYIGKPGSDPYIAMVSTPNAPGGLFQSIEEEKAELSLYHRIALDYRRGLDRIYTQEVQS